MAITIINVEESAPLEGSAKFNIDLTDGEQVTIARRLLGWSREQLAYNADVSSATIARIEQGKANLTASCADKITATFVKHGIRFPCDGKYGVLLIRNR